jgi:hypothetical protein
LADAWPLKSPLLPPPTSDFEPGGIRKRGLQTKEDGMSLVTQKLAKLDRIIALLEELVHERKASLARSSNGAVKKRKRRTGKELLEFRRLLQAERKMGVPVKVLAQRHGVSSAYIYLLP